MQEEFNYLYQQLSKIDRLSHMSKIISYDLETICPNNGKEDEGNLLVDLSNQIFKLQNDEKFIDAFEKLYLEKEKFDIKKRALLTILHKKYQKIKNIDEKFNEYTNQTFINSQINYERSKKQNNYEIFKPYLDKVIQINKKICQLRQTKLTNYEELLSDYEDGMKEEDLDKFFLECKNRIIPLLHKIQNSKKKINSDFLNRKVPIYQQEAFSKYLLNIIGFDLDSGAISTSVHPFTSGIYTHDARITTSYDENNFISNLYTIVHEGGHAIFEQNQDEEDFKNFISGNMSFGMHESVSRFYENRIARSYEFIKYIVKPALDKFFPNTFDDISSNDLYLAINKVSPSLIRTEADELTYTLHIIIRYEIEKDLVNKNIDINKLPEIWNQKYKEYLNVTPSNYSEGILQDIHWSTGFGYFPTYALGNAFNAMYFNKMKTELDISSIIQSKDLSPIKQWMKENVFKTANIYNSKQWIKQITSKEFTSDDFLNYLEEKYSKIYDL